jgi:hypothetical protein
MFEKQGKQKQADVPAAEAIPPAQRPFPWEKEP